jgi:hypothetical protein
MALNRERSGLSNPWGFAVGFCDALLAAQNASLSAESLGLGTCFLGSTLAATPGLCRFFECPPHVVPVTTLIMGYPYEEAHSPASRLPIEAIVHREVYHAVADDLLLDLYRNHADTTFAMFARMPNMGPAIEAFGITNLASLYGRLNYPRDLIEMASCFFLAAIAGQGFADATTISRTRAIREAITDATIASLPVARQLVFSLATATGALDGSLALSPAELEAKVFDRVRSVDPDLYDEFASAGVFHPGLRQRLQDAIS